MHPTKFLYSAYSDTLRLASIGILFLASMLGVVWPLWYYGRPVDSYEGKKLMETDAFFIVRSLAAGIMLGVAFIHLLAEGTTSLAEVVPDYSSLGYTLATCGIMFVLAVEQAMMSFVANANFNAVGGDDVMGSSSKGKKAAAAAAAAEAAAGMGDGDGNDACGEECVLQGDCDVHGGGTHSGRVARGVPGGSIVPTAGSRDIEMHSHSIHLHSHNHSHGHGSESSHAHAHSVVTASCLGSPGLIGGGNASTAADGSSGNGKNAASGGGSVGGGASPSSALIKAYLMEVSVATHSIIVGLNLGILAGEGNLVTLQALMVALCFHQFFEGVGLGCTIQEARLDLGHWNVVVFVLVFSSTVSIGVVIGYLMNKYPSTDDATETTILLFVKGAFNSITAGVLIYVSVVEMIAEDYQSMVTVGKPVLKLKMFAALMTGTLFMAILAYWA